MRSRMVVGWLLLSAGARLTVTGWMDAATRRAVASFKQARGLGIGSTVTAAAWRALLTLDPAPVTWRARRYAVAAVR